MATFTLTGTLTHQDAAHTPIAKSSIRVHADPFPDGGLVQGYGKDFATDASGHFSQNFTTGVTGLYYVVRSLAKKPVFAPVRFLAPAAGATVDLSTLTFYNPTSGPSPSESVMAGYLAAAQAAVASVKIGTWQASTAYVSGQTVQAPDGSLIKSNSSRTSGATFDATEQGFWTSVEAKAGTLANVAIDTATSTMRAGAGDQTAALNAFLAASSPLGVKTLVGSFTVSGSITVPAGAYVDATAATITTSLTSTSTVLLGAGSTWRGGNITGPSSWDGTNTAAAMAFAMLWVNGDNVTIDGVTLTNIYKVGVGIKDHHNVTVTGCHFVGNYPSGQWTGVETNHFAINSDPDSTGADLVIANNTIESCVQGVFIGNFGAGVGESATITGNLFKLCWNHGVYGYGYGMAVVGNAFHRCQIPIALDGQYHSITGNTIFTGTTGGTDQRDFTGISCRDSIGVTITGNTVRGNAPTASNIISVTAVTGTVVRDVVVADNIIDVAGGTSCGISVGSSATTCENISIHDNHIRIVGRANLGAITTAPAATALGCKIHDNTIVLLGNTHGIFVSNHDGANVHDNQIRIEFDSGSAITLGMVTTGSSTRTKIHDNQFRVSSAWGTNITVRGINEQTSSTAGKFENNEYLFDPTKIVSGTPIVLASGSGAVINEAGTGAPTLACGPGSMWRRTDSTTTNQVVYIKESAAGTATWRGL